MKKRKLGIEEKRKLGIEKEKAGIEKEKARD